MTWLRLPVAQTWIVVQEDRRDQVLATQHPSELTSIRSRTEHLVVPSQDVTRFWW